VYIERRRLSGIVCVCIVRVYVRVYVRVRVRVVLFFTAWAAVVLDLCPFGGRKCAFTGGAGDVGVGRVLRGGKGNVGEEMGE
jgi:hypothetical protein